MDDDLLSIQRCDPQVFHACHVSHPRSRTTNRFRVSERDQSLLAHLSFGAGTKATDLARHFGIGLPTLSEAMKRLERQGYVERRRSSRDRRALELALTPQGAAAVPRTSVLDDAHLERALLHLTPAERRAAARGLELLAGACRALKLAEAHR